MTYYCKRCQGAKEAKKLPNGRDKVIRFRSGYVARYLVCGHVVSVNDAPQAVEVEMLTN